MKSIYQLSFSTSGCEATAVLNGFPVLRASRDKQEMVSMPVNPLLVGKGNLLVLTVTARTDDARLEGSLSVAGEGEIVQIPGGGEIVLPDGAPPQTVEKRFDSEPDPFRTVLEKGKAVDGGAAIDFGIKLRDALKGPDPTSAGSLFEPKARIYAAAFQESVEMMREGLAQSLGEMARADLTFDRDRIEARPFCDGKVCELRQKDGRPLLVCGPDDEGATSQLQVFVADLGEGLGVIL
jgi:hypothetical protein